MFRKLVAEFLEEFKSFTMLFPSKKSLRDDKRFLYETFTSLMVKGLKFTLIYARFLL